MKKTKIIILICLIAAACVFGLWHMNERKESGVFDLADSGYYRVGTVAFDFYDFDYYIERFPSDEEIDAMVIPGKVWTAGAAVEIAERIWFAVFGEDMIKEERPYVVYFDKRNEVWLVRGTLPELMMGGTANILIEKNNGKILAVWHDR